MDIVPLYGFLEGDCIGLLVLAKKQDTVRELSEKLQHSARMRVSKIPETKLVYKDKVMDPHLTLAQAGFEALDRFDVLADVGGTER